MVYLDYSILIPLNVGLLWWGGGKASQAHNGHNADLEEGLGQLASLSTPLTYCNIIVIHPFQK
jgi:hypothetical protein